MVVDSSRPLAYETSTRELKVESTKVLLKILSKVSVMTDNVYVRLVTPMAPSTLSAHSLSGQRSSAQFREHLNSPIYHLTHAMNYVSMD